MCQSYVRLPRLFTSLAVAGMLGVGAHAAFAESTATSCPLTSEGTYSPGCGVEPAGNAGCDGACERAGSPDSAGECSVENCCLCET